MDNPPIISLSNLHFSFDDLIIFDDLSLNIPNGSIFGLLGKSGAGKTTLLRLLLGFYTTKKGSVLINNSTINHNQFKRMIGFATQENSFHYLLTVRENLHYYGLLYGLNGLDLEKRIDNLLGLVSLSDAAATVAKNLSGGMKRRLDFAISIIHDPSILILDEPAAGLDPVTREQIWSIIVRLHSVGKTIIVSSHLFDDLQSHCTDVGILHDKKIVFQGSLQDIIVKGSFSSLKEFFIRSVS